VVGLRFIWDSVVLLQEGGAHWPLAAVLSAASCAVIVSLQLYWGRVVLQEIWKVLVTSKKKNEKKKDN
jgi:hypothetical protein